MTLCRTTKVHQCHTLLSYEDVVLVDVAMLDSKIVQACEEGRADTSILDHSMLESLAQTEVPSAGVWPVSSKLCLSSTWLLVH